MRPFFRVAPRFQAVNICSNVKGGLPGRLFEHLFEKRKWLKLALLGPICVEPDFDQILTKFFLTRF